jgi:hypothetical protein
LGGRLNVVKMATLLKAMYWVNAVAIKIATSTFAEVKKLILKDKRLWIAKADSVMLEVS